MKITTEVIKKDNNEYVWWRNEWWTDRQWWSYDRPRWPMELIKGITFQLYHCRLDNSHTNLCGVSSVPTCTVIPELCTQTSDPGPAPEQGHTCPVSHLEQQKQSCQLHKTMLQQMNENVNIVNASSHQATRNIAFALFSLSGVKHPNTCSAMNAVFNYFPSNCSLVLDLGLTCFTPLCLEHICSAENEIQPSKITPKIPQDPYREIYMILSIDYTIWMWITTSYYCTVALTTIWQIEPLGCK